MRKNMTLVATKTEYEGRLKSSRPDTLPVAVHYFYSSREKVDVFDGDWQNFTSFAD